MIKNDVGKEFYIWFQIIFLGDNGIKYFQLEAFMGMGEGLLHLGGRIYLIIEVGWV